MEVRRLPDEFAMPPKERATGAEPAQMPPEIHCMTEERSSKEKAAVKKVRKQLAINTVW